MNDEEQQSDSNLPTLSDNQGVASQGGEIPRGRRAIDTALDTLPVRDHNGPLSLAGKKHIARDCDFDPTAIERAFHHRRPTVGQVLFNGACFAVVATIVYFVFPFERFFVPPAQESVDMTHVDRVSALDLGMGDAQTEWQRFLGDMQELQEANRVTEALERTRARLAELPPEDRPEWSTVYRFFWNLLEHRQQTRQLNHSTSSFLEVVSDDPYAIYYKAGGWLLDAQGKYSYASGEKQILADRGVALLGMLKSATENMADSNNLTAKGAEVKLAHWQNLRLREARIAAVLWRMGGYDNDPSSDFFRFRERALKTSEVLAEHNLREGILLRKGLLERVIPGMGWRRRIGQGTNLVGGRSLSETEVRREISRLDMKLERAEE